MRCAGRPSAATVSLRDAAKPAKPKTACARPTGPLPLPPHPRQLGAPNRPFEPDPPIQGDPMSAVLAPASPVVGRPPPGPVTPVPAPSQRPILEAGDPRSMEPKRITPRSPRAALEPEHVAVPTRRSKRARNPLVIVGNAIFTLLILVAVAGGAAFAFGKHRFESPGPLEQEKDGQHSAPPRHPRDRRPAAARRRDRRASAGLPRRRVRAQGAHRAQVRRIPLSQARERARRGRDHGRGQGGPAPGHDSRKA